MKMTLNRFTALYTNTKTKLYLIELFLLNKSANSQLCAENYKCVKSNAPDCTVVVCRGPRAAFLRLDCYIQEGVLGKGPLTARC